MRMQLFETKIVNSEGVFKTHIAAPAIKQASDFVKDYHREKGIVLTLIDLKRVDESLPPRRQRGLDAVLANAPTGLVAYDNTAGWFMQSTLHERMKLITIEPEGEESVFVVAPNVSVASAIWMVSVIDEDGLHPQWNFTLDTKCLPKAPRSALPHFLQFAPAGIAVWDEETGWSLKE